MSTDEQRAAFEAWVRKEHPHAWLRRDEIDADKYYFSETRLAWEVWQAAAEHEAVEVPKSIHELVFIAIGRASVCWENPAGGGVFDSTQATEVGNDLIEALKPYLKDY